MICALCLLLAKTPITRDFSVYHSRYAGNPPESRIAPVEIAGQSLRVSDSIGPQGDQENR